MKKQWYALRTKPHKAKSIIERLQTEKIEAYLPMARVNPTNPRAAKFKPYFPGYLFVHSDLEEDGINKFNWMPGAFGLIQFGGIPAVVPDNLIVELKQLMMAINEAGGITQYELQAGDTVRIISGPFEGYEAIFDTHLSGKDRVQVLLAFLSQAPQRLELDLSKIKKIKK